VAATKGTFAKLLAGACATLGVAATPSRASEVDTAALAYVEPDRVKALEMVIAANHDLGDDDHLRIKFVYDALTGASANGAVPVYDAVQTFTRPSGRGTYRIQPGDTPLDDTFRDARGALSAGLTKPLGRLTKLDFGVYGSGEHDYTSLGANAALSRDFQKRNRTVSLALSVNKDTISPEGGRPIPFAEMLSPSQTPQRLDGDGSKTVLDGILGVSQVIDRSTVVQVNYSVSVADGYQTDPYKVVSVVDPVTGLPTAQLYEHRPDKRTKHIVYGLLKRHLSRDVVELSYRFMSDDWGVTSHTADARYRLQLGGDPGTYLQPHLRWYRQEAADSYTPWLLDGETLPEFATADYRLGPMTAWTYGMKFGRPVGENRRVTFRLEYYRQTPDNPADAPGQLAQVDLLPPVSAVFAQVGFTTEF